MGHRRWSMNICHISCRVQLVRAARGDKKSGAGVTIKWVMLVC